MTKSLKIALAALCITGIGASAAPANPLLGRWLAEPGPLDRSGFDTCAAVPALDFEPASQTMYTAAEKFRPAGKLTTQVIYFVAGNKIYVSSTPGFAGAPMYTLIGPGEVRDNSGCKYRRR